MKDVIVVGFGPKDGASIVKSLEKRNIPCLRVNWEDIESNVETNYFEGVKAIMLSGSPNLDVDVDMPIIKKEIVSGRIPVLGICYGMQLISYIWGSKVAKAEKDEHGLTEIEFFDSVLFNGITSEKLVEMRHYWRVYDLPKGFNLTGSTKDCPIAAIESVEKNVYATQFHPELGGCGDEILDNFLYKICKIKNNSYDDTPNII